MKHLLAVFLLASLLCGCAEEQQQVQQTGHSVNLLPTQREVKAGY
jgi:hypothetical protein